MTNRNRTALRGTLAGVALCVSTMPASAQSDIGAVQAAAEPIATFVPNDDRVEHRIDYSIWTSALNSFVISMGPPLRKKPFEVPSTLGTRQRAGHNSMYRLDGAMMGFSFMPPPHHRQLHRISRGSRTCSRWPRHPIDPPQRTARILAEPSQCRDG